jgi:hypothetical protein
MCFPKSRPIYSCFQCIFSLGVEWSWMQVLRQTSFDHHAGRKRPKWRFLWTRHKGDWIELIPFALFLASPDTSFAYPQHIIQRTLKFHFFRVTHLCGPMKIFVGEKKLISCYWHYLSFKRPGLTQCKRNQLNLITMLGENDRSVSKCQDILGVWDDSSGQRWSDWADSFCIVSGSSRHKFWVSATYYSENFEIPLF